MSDNLADFSLFDLFRMEAEEQVRVLQTELLALEQNPGTPDPRTLEALMRAAHSLKGAARIVGLDVIVHLTHAVEERLVEAQQGTTLASADIDRLLTATDWLARLQAVPEAETAAWLTTHTSALEAFTASFTPSSVASEAGAPFIAPVPHAMSGSASKPEAPPPTPDPDIFATQTPTPRQRERNVRIAADRFDQILSLASEALVSSRHITTHADTFEQNRRLMARALQMLEDPDSTPAARASALRELDRQTTSFATHLAEFDQIARAGERTAEAIYRTVLAGRLRPFADGISAISRMVRDTSRDLGKQVQLEILGENTRVDRDILERLEAPVSHLVANAIDHGIETPAERIAAAKPPTASLRLHARHENGRLVITVRDDGRGIDPEHVRTRIVARNLVSAENAATLSDPELLEFLFLPGFSTREQVSAVSGRGVGLNIVQSMVQEAGGSVVVTSDPGVGTRFRLTLPVTRSVLKTIRVEVEGERYAVPLVRIDSVATLEAVAASGDPASTLEQGPMVEHAGQRLPVVSLAALLGFSNRPLPPGPIPLVIAGGVAFAVSRLVDQVELPVRRLDARLGKIPGVSAASLDENGLPILILDVEDLIQTALGHPAGTATASDADALSTPHILIVDDSHTVREMERRLLARAGYQVTAAQNGQEAWNLLRLNPYDLLISDVDMPQMNGIELVERVRANPRLTGLPVIILSYKDREEDRHRGLEAGADFYLTKGDFENNAFLQAVVDLIGSA